MIGKTDMIAGLRYRQKVSEDKAKRTPTPEIRKHHEAAAAEFRRRADDLVGPDS